MDKTKRIRERPEYVKNALIVKLAPISKLRAECEVGGMQFQFLGL